MLFIFPESDYISIWIANTYVPLSVAFINNDGVVINVASMAPLITDLHRTRAPAKYAIEMQRGWFKRHGVKVGERLLDSDIIVNESHIRSIQ